MGITEAQVIEEWCSALSNFYSLVRGERLGELRDRRSRLLDNRGLHPASLEIGRIQACEALLPELDVLEFNHHELKQAAQQDAVEEYELEVALNTGLRYGWISEKEALAMRLHP
jgi:hypothetical protein